VHSHDREIFTLAIPALGALLAEPLYLLADTAVVGHLGTSELAGLAVASSALLFTYGMCVFLAYGTTSTVARLTGAGKREEATGQVVQSLWLGIGLGALLAIFGRSFADPLLRLLGANGQEMLQAKIYFNISLIGAPAMLLMLAGVGWLRGIKDTVKPLKVAVGTAALNLVLELVLIYGFNLGIGASAAATVVAQWVGAICYLGWILPIARQQGISLRPRRATLTRLIGISTDLLIRNLALTGTLLFVTAGAARIGNVEVAAHQIAFQIWMLLALSMDAVAIAAQAMVGNLLGAKDPTTARSVGQRITSWSIAIGAVLGTLLISFHNILGHLFTDDKSVIALTGFLLLHVGLMAPLSGVAFALDGILIGAGDQRFLAKAMTVSALVSIPLTLTVRILDLGIGPLWAGVWVLMLTRAGTLWLRFKGGRWQTTDN